MNKFRKIIASLAMVLAMGGVVSVFATSPVSATSVSESDYFFSDTDYGGVVRCSRAYREFGEALAPNYLYVKVQTAHHFGGYCAYNDFNNVTNHLTLAWVLWYYDAYGQEQICNAGYVATSTFSNAIQDYPAFVGCGDHYYWMTVTNEAINPVFGYHTDWSHLPVYSVWLNG